MFELLGKFWRMLGVYVDAATELAVTANVKAVELRNNVVEEAGISDDELAKILLAAHGDKKSPKAGK